MTERLDDDEIALALNAEMARKTYEERLRASDAVGFALLMWCFASVAIAILTGFVITTVFTISMFF